MKASATLLLFALTTGSAVAGDTTLDAAIGGGIGGAAGGAVGAELGGRDGAILGGALGAAVGTAISTDSASRAPYDRVEVYRDNRRHYGHPFYRHCPPGQAKKGRC